METRKLLVIKDPKSNYVTKDFSNRFNRTVVDTKADVFPSHGMAWAQTWDGQWHVVPDDWLKALDGSDDDDFGLMLDIDNCNHDWKKIYMITSHHYLCTKCKTTRDNL